MIGIPPNGIRNNDVLAVLAGIVLGVAIFIGFFGLQFLSLGD